MSTNDFLDYLKRQGFIEIRRTSLTVVVQKQNPGKPITTVPISSSLSGAIIRTICHNLNVPVPPKAASIP